MNIEYWTDNVVTHIGGIKVTSLLDGWISLDGGAMYGIVPKTLWDKQLPADERNRVKMAMRPLLVETPTHKVVIESGIGHAIPADLHDRYGISRIGPTLDELVKLAGVDPSAIDVVTGTHLHWDHSGGLCKLVGENYVPNFPNAKHVFQKGEWQIATNPTNLHKASYNPASLKPIEEAGLLKLVDKDGEIVPGLRYEFTAGHTENHAVVWIESAGESGIFLGDLVPTTSHIPKSWISAYDINAGGSYVARESLYPSIIDSDATCFFYHEPQYPVSKITKEGRKYRIAPITKVL